MVDNKASAGFGVVLGGLIGGLGTAFVIGAFSPRVIPSTSKVQEGFIAPSQLEEITCQDLDHNGEPETLVKIGGTSYLLREVDGKPVLSAYRVLNRSAEIVYE